MNELTIENTQRKINYQIKVLYALGMLFIVCDHSSMAGLSLFTEWFPFRGFHVALFVFCSGYLYNLSSEEDVRRYCIKKAKNLLVPLYLWNFAYGLLVWLLGFKGFEIGNRPTVENLLILPLNNGHQFEYNMGGWFVISLFLIEILNILVRKILPVNGPKKEILLFILYLLIGIAGNYAAIKGYRQGWWLVPVRMAHLLPFWGFGMLYRNVLEKWDKLNSAAYFLVVAGIQLTFICILGKVPTYLPSWCKDFVDGPLVPALYGMVAIAFWLRIAKILVPAIGHSRVVLAVANNSYSIMINQFLGFMLVKTVYAFLSKFTGLFPDFDIHLYKTDIWYYYFPGGYPQMGILYIIAGLAIPVLLQKAVDRILQKR